MLCGKAGGQRSEAQEAEKEDRGRPQLPAQVLAHHPPMEVKTASPLNGASCILTCVGFRKRLRIMVGTIYRDACGKSSSSFSLLMLRLQDSKWEYRVER
jgi:hypothetical protein